MRLATQLAAVQKYVLGRATPAPAGIRGSRTFPKLKRLGVYRDGYFLRLHEALSANFPVLKAYLGDAGFDRLVAAFTVAHPSQNFSLRPYGDKLSKFAATRRPFSTRPVIAEIAALECIMADAFDAADIVPLTASDLSAFPPAAWAAASFEFHPSLQMIRTRWNAVAIWRALNNDASRPGPVSQPIAESWIVWRRNLEVLFERITPAERSALQAACRGRCFAQICELAPRRLGPGEQAAWAAHLLRAWVDRGWLTGLVQN
jgi:hypothetical protein